MTAAHDPLAASMVPCRAWCLRLGGVFVGMAALGGIHAGERSIAAAPLIAVADTAVAPAKAQETRMWMTAGARRFDVTLADTDAARAFVARLPMTLDMTDLNDNEKKFDLSRPLPANPSRPGTIRHGDLLLWGDNTVVVFYKTFESAYAYTRLGRLSHPTDLAQVLGRGSVRVQFTVQP